jgi:hypothetical protein
MSFEQRLRLVRRVAFAGGNVTEALAQLDDAAYERRDEAHSRIVRWACDAANGELPKPRKRR